MLKRIQSIQNIGRFKATTAGNVEFDKITLIFGRNTYGKSTLGDLLASIELSETSAITTRRTIPADGRPQQAVLSFQAEGQSETPIRLDQNGWNPGLPVGLCLRVFDDGFYHNNVFAARQFTRSTKENFSSFVLGAQGVAKAQVIAEKNKQKGDATRERNKLQKAAFKNISDLSNFLKLNPAETVDLLKDKIDSLRRESDNFVSQKDNAEKIQSRKTLNLLKWEISFTESLERLNKILAASYINLHDDARLKVIDHIQRNFHEQNDAEIWIKNGLAHNNGGKCQFCGQVLGEEAIKLLDIYRQYFNSSYQEHESYVVKELDECKTLLTQERVVMLRLSLESNKGSLVSYPELEKREDFLELSAQLEKCVDNIAAVLESWVKQSAEFNKQIEQVVNRKISRPHSEINQLESKILLQLNEQIIELISIYNDKASRINELIIVFKESVNAIRLKMRIDAINDQINIENLKLLRVEMADQCEEMIRLDTLVAVLAEEIPLLQEELRNEQSSYLDNFFDHLNYYFKKFGSSDFTLIRGEDTSGHTPIYYLKVKYCNCDVSERDLDKVFSESDRRALALAVFWAGLSCLNEENIRNTIIVLDDPITSFDNHRTTTVHQEIVILAEKSRQIIILSHYEQGLVKFINTYSKNKPIKLLTIERKSGTSSLQVADIDHFVKNEHEKARSNLFKFIAEETNTHNAGDLRVFLEYELNHRFAKQIDDNNINESNLSDRIDKLRDAGCITQELCSGLHNWRELLNPAHHIWLASDLEDQRNTAKRFMGFIYHDLIPTCLTS